MPKTLDDEELATLQDEATKRRQILLAQPDNAVVHKELSALEKAIAKMTPVEEG